MSTAVTELSTHRLPAAWQGWLAENLMLGLDPGVLAEIVVAAGHDRAVAEAESDRIRATPGYQAGRRIAERLLKTESLLAVHHRLASLEDAEGTVPRQPAPGAEVFLRDYYSRNRPVLMPGLARGWPAYATWSPAHLRAECGAESVEVMAARDADRSYEVNSEAHKQPMLFSEYVDQVLALGTGNDIYLVANNHFLDLPATRHLVDDLRPMPEFLDATRTDGSIFLWFGPAGTVTPLHHDTMNVLLVQVQGRKKVTLVPSTQLPFVYNDTAVYSAVDVSDPDLGQHPLYASASPAEVVLGAGDGLFIPVGWWHHVRSLDVSISVSFTNFAFPNDYVWQHPTGQR